MKIEISRPATIAAARWQAIETRDARFDGKFLYAVRTTRIFCKPSCPARRPRRENVVFFKTIAAAQRAGFRACKRCSPGGHSRTDDIALKMSAVCRLIERADHCPTLSELAKQVSLSPDHLQRVFKATIGLTPKAYADACRAKGVRSALQKAHSVTEAIYEAGFGSSGRFYESSNRLLGMTPRALRAGGASEKLRFAVGECSLGAILVAASDRGVCCVLLGDDPGALVRDLEDRFPRATLIGTDPSFEQTVATVVGFIESPTAVLNVPLDIRGTAFQQRVWNALLKIPVGSTSSYSEIARRLGSPNAVRAVARACAANAIAVAIPCHRVVRNDGSLSGYRWGIERKGELLTREANQSSGKKTASNVGSLKAAESARETRATQK